MRASCANRVDGSALFKYNSRNTGSLYPRKFAIHKFFQSHDRHIIIRATLKGNVIDSDTLSERKFASQIGREQCYGIPCCRSNYYGTPTSSKEQYYREDI